VRLWGRRLCSSLAVELLHATGTLFSDQIFKKEIGGCDMHSVARIVPLLFAFVLMLAVGVSLAAPVPGSKDYATKTTTRATTKNNAAASKSAMKSPAKSAAKKTSHVLASAENLSGTITVVDPTDKEVTLVGSNGVPYDFKLTKKTQVELSDKKIGVNELAGELAGESHKRATVHFVPRSDGNLAESIQISAS
jgi:hypothetical protein